MVKYNIYLYNYNKIYIAFSSSTAVGWSLGSNDVTRIDINAGTIIIETMPSVQSPVTETIDNIKVGNIMFPSHSKPYANVLADALTLVGYISLT